MATKTKDRKILDRLVIKFSLSEIKQVLINEAIVQGHLDKKFTDENVDSLVLTGINDPKTGAVTDFALVKEWVVSDSDL